MIGAFITVTLIRNIFRDNILIFYTLDSIVNIAGQVILSAKFFKDIEAGWVVGSFGLAYST